MANWWLTNIYAEQGLPGVLIWTFWIIGSVVLHELAHGFTAIRHGDNTPRELGHITANPIVHMGWSGVLMFAVLGVTWGSMPVNPGRLRRWFDNALVSVAGPATNLGLSLISILGLVVLFRFGAPLPDGLISKMQLFFTLGAMLNMALAILNMLPLYPLDGGRILGTFVPVYAMFARSRQGAFFSLFVLVMIFFFGGSVVFPAARRAVLGLTMVFDSAFDGGTR